MLVLVLVAVEVGTSSHNTLYETGQDYDDSN